MNMKLKVANKELNNLVVVFGTNVLKYNAMISCYTLLSVTLDAQGIIPGYAWARSYRESMCFL
jgi:hypothetical protein